MLFSSRLPTNDEICLSFPVVFPVTCTCNVLTLTRMFLMGKMTNIPLVAGFFLNTQSVVLIVWERFTLEMLLIGYWHKKEDCY